ncbi:hypothetical protein DFA_10151 [Cavenderia fasciculata]|uniref:N-acetyltransferase domain-containing protein n=1 Tax=Cavenderia fasciculata TaxID=261658 RepID=F4Q9E8_CACFS|nr:uncharacterized protein DFA_10151 [Cavenderia fasciculata]EGG15317.1 hypothetical protein DFA_10151 [Cavenderia fasciculata]|eukprot:XP_004352037.1 hypothetical protein DFA_10151 [Cavenderia fasciculata]
MFQSYANQNQTTPTFKTKRLLLEPFTFDATKALNQEEDEEWETIEELAGDAKVAMTTQFIPHPYPTGASKSWIASQQKAWSTGTDMTLAIKLIEQGPTKSKIIGVISIMSDIYNGTNILKLGYWIGSPYWNNGYATEASLVIVDFVFNTLNISCLWASCMSHNIGSERVFQKIGMKYQYSQPLVIRGQPIDCKFYNITK